MFLFLFLFKWTVNGFEQGTRDAEDSFCTHLESRILACPVNNNDKFIRCGGPEKFNLCE
jgi:hypothetical protein